MIRTAPRYSYRRTHNRPHTEKKLSKLILAAGLYVLLAVILFQPHQPKLQRFKILLAINPPVAALGCYVLSRRWVGSFIGSLIGGAVYGFGPFMLHLAKFHPTAGTLAAVIPYLFWPAALLTRRRRRWLQGPLALLPFAAIVVFFQLATYARLFPVSTQARLRPADLASLLAPIVWAKRSFDTTLLGVYHVPLAMLLIGLLMALMARRFGTLLVLAGSIALACAQPILQVSPVMWLSITMVIAAVVTSVGIGASISAGSADRKWLLAATVVLAVATIVSLFAATKCFQTFLGLGAPYARIFVEAAKMYLLGALAMAILLFMARTHLLAHPLRALVLLAAMGIDIYRSACVLTDMFF